MTTIHDKIGRISSEQFTDLMDLLCSDMNLGAGIQVSGDSGSGKSNLGEHLFIRSFERGIPSIFFDPHGDSTKKILRSLLEKSRSKAQEKLLYLNVSDLSTSFGFNPLYTSHVPEDIVPYEAQVLKRVETTSKIIFSLFGESEFEGRTKLRQYLTLWISMLAKSGLTLGDASIFSDPDSPVYQQLVELAPTDKVRNKLAKLIGQRPSEIEKEIGSTETRVGPVLAHPVCQTMFTRRENNLDFRWLIENDYSILVDLSMSAESPDGQEYPDALTEEVQQLICNLMLSQYLDVLKTIPLSKRKQRLLFIDELPVFESSGSQLMKACTEIRKFQTKFVFMHQGSTRFPGGTDNPFFKAICKMCAANVYFRHTGEDAEFFAQPLARRFFDPVEVKYMHWVDQQFSLEPEIVELFSESSGSTTTVSRTETKNSQKQVTDSHGTSSSEAHGTSNSSGQTDTLGTSVDRFSTSYDESERENRSSGSTQNQGLTSQNSYGSNNSHAVAIAQGTATQKGKSNADSSSTTRSQALKGRAETRSVLQSVTFKSADEQTIECINLVEMQKTGDAVVVVKGVGIVRALVPEVKPKLPNLTRVVDRYVRQFFANQLKLPWFSDANEEYRKRLEFEASISGYLKDLILEKQQRTNPRIVSQSQQPQLKISQTKSPSGHVIKEPQPNSKDQTPKVSQHDPEWYDGEF